MLLPISDMVRRSFTPYQRHTKLMVAYMAIIFGIYLVKETIPLSFDLQEIIAGSTTVGLLFVRAIGLLIMQIPILWITLSLIYLYRDIHTGATVSTLATYVKQSIRVLIPSIGIVLLVSICVMAGLVPLVGAIFLLKNIALFVLLVFPLLIPVIMIGVWLFFSLQSRILDDKRGLNALLHSKSLVRGKWWDVFGRILMIFIIAYVVIQVLYILFGPLFGINIAGEPTLQMAIAVRMYGNIMSSLSTALLTPFIVGYGTILYLNLVREQGK